MNPLLRYARRELRRPVVSAKDRALMAKIARYTRRARVAVAGGRS